MPEGEWMVQTEPEKTWGSFSVKFPQAQGVTLRNALLAAVDADDINKTFAYDVSVQLTIKVTKT